MDALSTHQLSSSLLPKPSLFPTPHPTTTPHHPLKPPPPSKLSTKLSLPSQPLSLLPTPSPHPHPSPSPPTTHHKAATGYAAALLDVARCDGTLVAVARDVRRLRRLVRAVLDDQKGEAVKVVAEKGGFYGKLVVLVRMLVAKGKVGMVGEVLEEFERLWGELTTKVKVIKVRNYPVVPKLVM